MKNKKQTAALRLAGKQQLFAIQGPSYILGQAILPATALNIKLG